METNDILNKKFGKGAKEILVHTKDCVIYTRVSDRKQMDNLSLETQLKFNELHAKRHGMIVREHFGGTYESAKNDERKEFQRMIHYVKNCKYKISFILVYSLDRFSRNENSIWLASQLRKLGIEIVSVTQPIDTSNPAGQLQQKMLLLFGEHDNQLRRQKCMAGTKERLLKGEWCNKPPLGYDIIYINGERKIAVNDKGRLLKKAFYWKMNEDISLEEIRIRLEKQNLKLGINRVSEILRNPFYCGMMAHKALEGELFEGKHEKLISKEIFIRVNDLSVNKSSGFKQVEENNLIPLKRFLKCESCKEPMRGYIAKQWNLPYYKCNTPGCKCNRNANDINDRFVQELSKFKISEKHRELIKYQTTATFVQLNKGREETDRSIKHKIQILSEKIERLEERYVMEELSGDLYQKYVTKLQKERDDLEKKLQNSGIEMSKLDAFIEYIVHMAENPHEMWHSSDYANRQKLQYMVFPGGMLYSRKKDECRSDNPNPVFAYIADLSGVLGQLKATSVKHLQKIPLSSS